MKRLRYVWLLAALCACNSQDKTSKTDTTKVDTTMVSAAQADVFTKPVVIVITPSDRLISQMKAKMEGNEYNTVVDDNGFYLSQCEHYLDSVKANKINRQSEGVIKFKTTKGNTYEMKLDTVFFGVMLFNGKDKPVMGDMTAIRGDYEQVMKR